MNPESTTPLMLEAQWENDHILELFDDLSRGAQVEHVQVRVGSTPDGRDQSLTLNEARSLFESGDAIAIQIRYEFDSSHWCDTLMVGPRLTRIIRTQSDFTHND